MISKNEVLKMVRTIYRHDRGLPPRRLIYPAREWGIGVLVTAVLIIVACVSTAALYLSLDNIEERLEPSEVSTIRYQDKTMERALEQMVARADRFAAAVTVQPVLVPSTVATSTATTTTETIQSEETETVSEASESLEVF